MASSYTAFDATKPAGTQTGPQFATSANANDVASEDDIITGQPRSWAFSQVVGSGTAEQPQYMVWSSGTNRVRATITWGSAGGAAGNLSAITWEVSQDSGTTPNSTGTWASMGTAQSFTYDASGNLTATANAGGMLSFVSYLIGKVKALLATVTAHIAAVGTAVHGLGSMAIQAATAVAITGGTLSGIFLDYITAKGKCINLGATLSGTVNIDMATADYFYGTITGITTFAILNKPAADHVQSFTLELTNPGAFAVTWPTGTKWPNATAPTRTVSGKDLYEFTIRDGSTPIGSPANLNFS